MCLIFFIFAISALNSETFGVCKLTDFKFFKSKFLNLIFKYLILFLGRFLSIIKAAYRYNKPDDRNLSLYLLAISFAPVDFPVAAPPSQEI